MVNNSSEILATNGDTFLGGEDFDSALIDYLVDEFKRPKSQPKKGDSLAMQRLKEAAEKAKLSISSAQSTEVNLPYITAWQQWSKAFGCDHQSLKARKSHWRASTTPCLQKLLLKMLA